MATRYASSYVRGIAVHQMIAKRVHDEKTEQVIERLYFEA